MQRKGGCCLAPRYGAAAAAAQHQQAGAAWQMGRIMLKFRPIAPKPAAMAPAPSAPTPVPGPAVGAAGRRKRKAVCAGGVRKGRKPKNAATAAVAAAAPTAAARDAGACSKHCEKEKEKEKSSSSRSSSSSGMTSVDSSPPPPPPPPGPQQQQQLATLPFMPVTPVEDKAAAGAATEEPAPAPAPVPSQVAALTAGEVARPFAPRAARPGPAAAASLVTVEEVTATWRDGEAAPCGVGSGAADEAPTFVSDPWGRVTWGNAAFVRAVSSDGDDGGDVEETPVAVGGAYPAWGTCAGFTCRVRVRVRVRRVGSCSSVVAPCDVWRLDAGGSYLWRLDLQAALTLGGRL